MVYVWNQNRKRLYKKYTLQRFVNGYNFVKKGGGSELLDISTVRFGLLPYQRLDCYVTVKIKQLHCVLGIGFNIGQCILINEILSKSSCFCLFGEHN